MTVTEQAEYLDEIREEVCSRCVERPLGGPPCQTLGKPCGIELHLPELIDSIRQVHSNQIAPYLKHNRENICARCALLHTSTCPCPMDYLAVLVVDAIERVDSRRGETPPSRIKNGRSTPTLDDVLEAYGKGAGSWTGCDWRTNFGKSGLDLQGMDSHSLSQWAEGSEGDEDWRAAVRWLHEVERRAGEAERKAAAAVKAAEDERLGGALHLVESAWALEFSTGRPMRSGVPLAWQELRGVIEAGYLAQQKQNS